MRKFCIPFFIICIFGTIISYAQPIDSDLISGGGPLRLFEGACVTPEQRERHRAGVQRNIDSLRAIGKLPQEFPESTEVLELQWPITSTLSDYGYHRLGHFPDHDNQSNSLLDYMCGDRTYDRSSDGYDHRGTDIFGWPFNWHKMDNDEVQVIAAAPGTIIDKEDGNFDRECATINSGNTNWNDITIVHSDGTEAWYTHFKMNSLTYKGIGETVQAGEYLGIIGSSGWAWEPHLHFELSSSGGSMRDPNVGDCNTNPPIKWADGVQPPYFDSAINKIMTHSAPPDFDMPCPTPATINEKNDFVPGDILYVAGYYRDQLAGQTAQYTIYKPDDTVFQTWTHNITQNFPHPSIFRADWANASHWWWSWSLPLDSPGGSWRVEAVYEGNTYEHYFTVIPDDPMPVFLASFGLEWQGSGVNLTWITQSEINNQGFIIKRKRDGQSQFLEIASYLHNPELKGKGTYSGSSTYAYEDNNASSGLHYQYQLVSVSYDGVHEIIAARDIQTNPISLAPDEIRLFQNYPNPFNGNTVISYFLPEDILVSISIYNSLGQELLTLVNSKKSKGIHRFMWNTNAYRLSTGTYFVVLKASDSFITQKCLLVN